MWNLLLNDEQAMIAEAVRAYLSRELPLDRLRPQATAPWVVAQVHAGMAELGWFGVGLPEAVNGLGLGLVEEMLVQRECGRYLASPAVLATVLGAHVALHAGDARLAGDMAQGKQCAALAVLTAPRPEHGQGPVYAFDWSENDLLLAWSEEGMGLFNAEDFSHVESQVSLDESLTLHTGRLAMNRAKHWVSPAQAPLALRAQVLLAARLAGLADHACELTVEYAKVREQFGKPIGAFQAVKHRCADMAIRARLSWSQTRFACLKVQAQAADAALQAAAAKLLAAEAARENGRAAIQLHGAIGFQAECDAHWFMKRAHLYDQAGGSRRALSRRIIAEASPL